MKNKKKYPKLREMTRISAGCLPRSTLTEDWLIRSYSTWDRIIPTTFIDKRDSACQILKKHRTQHIPSSAKTSVGAEPEAEAARIDEFFAAVVLDFLTAILFGAVVERLALEVTVLKE